MKQIVAGLLLMTGMAVASHAETIEAPGSIQLGPRPFYLIDDMDEGPLKEKLKSCQAGPFEASTWSIAHRGAPLQFPEHTRESYVAAARMGAGIGECDVAFTRDRQLVCRHAQDDLHTTTDILATDLASKCTKAFSPASGNTEASAECRTSDITLAEFRTLNGKMDAGGENAATVEDYMNATVNWRTDLYASRGTLMTHAESIELFRSLGMKFAPELKKPAVEMPFEEEYTRAMYAQQFIDEYKAAGVSPADVFPQSFELEDIQYWIENEPEFGRQAVYLEDSYDFIDGWSHMDPSTWDHSMRELKEMGVNYISPPLWVLVTTENGKIVPSVYAKEAKAAGLNIIAWSAERTGPLKGGGAWYYQSIKELVNNDGDIYNLFNVLHEDIEVVGIFSDWPATTTYYANCFGLK